MKNNLIVFGAVYLVVLQGFILLSVSLQQNSTVEKVTIFVSGSLVLLTAFIIMKILKRIIHKRRPPKSIEMFKPFDRYAFPSGHATGLSSVTFFILENSLPLGLLSLFVSVLVVISRVRAHVHDSVDIIGGILLGTFIAFSVSPFVRETVFKVVSSYFL